MEKQFSGKVALVTGASNGIGKATAIAFAAEGANVVLSDVVDGQAVVDEIKGKGGNAVFVACDVSDEQQVKAMVEQTLAAYGRLDFAFNNAGVEGVFSPVEAMDSTAFNKVIDINLKGVFYGMKYQVPVMKQQGGGVIVNCASIAGLVGFPGAVAYVASKHAVVGMTKTVALDNAKQNIRVNAICPGVIKTPMIDRFTGGKPEAEAQLTQGEPVGRIGQPEEIASAVIWLCTAGASFTTGQAIAVDGGWVAQ